MNCQKAQPKPLASLFMVKIRLNIGVIENFIAFFQQKNDPDAAQIFKISLS